MIQQFEMLHLFNLDTIKPSWEDWANLDDTLETEPVSRNDLQMCSCLCYAYVLALPLFSLLALLITGVLVPLYILLHQL